jgi:hypothetical protein
MPRGDRTGPQNENPMTGRQLGYGAGYDSPGYTKGPGMGIGRGFFGRGRNLFGRGRGQGFFWTRRDVAPEEIREIPVRDDEVNALRSEIQDLKTSLSAILDRLNMLAPKKEDK